MDLLHQKYPWLVTWKHSDYLSPNYYQRLLKPYVFGGRDDLTLFDDFLASLKVKPQKALELGCGSGRGTEVFLKRFPKTRLDVLDLSPQMLEFTHKHFPVQEKILSDTFNYLSETKEKYDFVFSLWSFSHSLHQHLETATDLERGKSKLSDVLKNFIVLNLEKDGDFFIIHFDSQSDEQKILMKQWAKTSPVYDVGKQQSLSLQVIERTLNDLQQAGIVSFSITHFVGEPIVYDDINLALETFLNFHLEGCLNNRPEKEITSIIDELSGYFNRFLDPKTGKISIKPGCFIIKIHKG